MKRSVYFSLAILFLVAGSVWGDSGKAMIVTVNNYTTQTVINNYYNGSQSRLRNHVNIPSKTDHNDVVNNSIDEDGDIRLPPPFDLPAGAGVSLSFQEPEQQAILIWSGVEEILVLSTNEKSSKASPTGTASLSIVPLPGKLLHVNRANVDIFKRAVRLFTERTKPIVNNEGLAPKTQRVRIGAHTVFPIEASSKHEFQEKAYQEVRDIYKEQNILAEPKITHGMLEIIGDYIEQGYRDFACDIAVIHSKISTKESIAYHFKSDFVYYPLHISKLGSASRKTDIKLAIITHKAKIHTFTKLPGSKRKGFDVPAAARKGRAQKVHGMNAAISLNDLQNIFDSPKLSPPDKRKIWDQINNMFNGYSKINRNLTMRYIYIVGNLDSFDGDLLAK